MATEGVAVDAGVLARTIREYTGSIGDIEQGLAGEDHMLDPLLARPRASAASAPEPGLRFESSSSTDEPRATVAERRPAPVGPAAGAPPAPSEPVSADTIERFLVARLAAALRIRESLIDPNRSFFDYGLDSVTTVLLVAALEEWLGIECSPELPYDVRIIRRYASQIARQYASSRQIREEGAET
jgi:acyl carrier protein